MVCGATLFSLLEYIPRRVKFSHNLFSRSNCSFFLIENLFYNFRLIFWESSLWQWKHKLVPFEREFTSFPLVEIKNNQELKFSVFRCTQRHNKICCNTFDKSFKIGDHKTEKQLLTFFSTFPITSSIQFSIDVLLGFYWCSIGFYWRSIGFYSFLLILFAHFFYWRNRRNSLNTSR